MQRDMICILCPVGCMLTVSQDDEGNVSVKGNACRRGVGYGETELTHPERMVTSTVRVRGGETTLCSVKTRRAVPKAKVDEVLGALNDVCMLAPVRIGDVALSNAAGTGVDIVATRNVKKREKAG